MPLTIIHTLQLNFLFSDWFFSKYVECIENVQYTLRTVPRLREVLLLCDRTRDHHIDFALDKVDDILHVKRHFKTILSNFFQKHEQKFGLSVMHE